MKQTYNIIKDLRLKLKNINFISYIYLRGNNNRFFYLLYHSELTDIKTFNSFYLPLLKETLSKNVTKINEDSIANLFSLSSELKDIEQHLFLGHLIILDSLNNDFYYLDCSNAPHRETSAPPGDNSSTDAHDGLVESILINESLIRKRLKSTVIKSENYLIGNVTKTNVNIIYHENMKKTYVLNKIRNKIKKCDIEALVTMSQFEKEVLNEDGIFTSFTYTSRTSFIAHSLVKGKVVVLVDGMPIALIFPSSLHNFLEYADNSLEHYTIKKIDHFIYTIALLISLFLLGFSTAMLAYTPDFIPIVLLYNIYNARQGISYPIQVELIIASLFFQLFRLAGTRNVSGINSALLMVGSIIIGQVSVTSGIIGQEVLLICAISTISTYIISDNLSFNSAIFICQSIIFISSMFLGLTGFILSSIGVLIYLSDIEFYKKNFIQFRGVEYYLGKWSHKP